MYSLRKIPFLDKQTENYLNLIQIEPKPTEDALKNFITTISPPQLSPFSPSNTCCITVMRDETRNTCRRTSSNIVQTYGEVSKYLQAGELPHAVRIWRESGFSLDADMTKIFKKEDYDILAVMVK